MKLVVQRVNEAHVCVEAQIVGKIDRGLLVLIGVTHNDTYENAAYLASKMINLRIFEDEQGKMNCSLLETKGKALIISQFTLYGDCKEGRRPSFTQAASPEMAKKLYEHFVEEVKKGGIVTQTGIFGAEMNVFSINNGPVTLILERKL